MEEYQEKNKTDLSQEFNATYKKVSLKVREELCTNLSWSISTFYSRLDGRRAIREREIPVIKRIFKKYGIEIFT